MLQAFALAASQCDYDNRYMVPTSAIMCLLDRLDRLVRDDGQRSQGSVSLTRASQSFHEHSTHTRVD